VDTTVSHPRHEYEEEAIAELLRALPPAPKHWVQAAKELPAARREFDTIVERARIDAEYRRELLEDLEKSLRRAGHADDSMRVAALRARLTAITESGL
jgi:hypothetical protein